MTDNPLSRNTAASSALLRGAVFTVTFLKKRSQYGLTLNGITAASPDVSTPLDMTLMLNVLFQFVINRLQIASALR